MGVTPVGAAGIIVIVNTKFVNVVQNNKTLHNYSDVLEHSSMRDPSLSSG
jgi:hypothetical protein